MSNWRGVLITLVAGCLLLTACTSRQNDSNTAALKEKDVQEDGQVLTVITPTASKTQSAASEANQKYQIQTRLTDFQLLSDTTGIAWGLTRGELRLYMTQDNGETWTNISPAATVQFPKSISYGKEMFFLDPKHGWIVRKAQGNTESIILRTEDGGTSWKIGTLPKEVELNSLFFLTTSRGWLMSTTDSGLPGNQKKTLYSTYDGGMSWSKSNDRLEESLKEKQSNQLPDFGYFLGMVFRNVQQGFVMLQELNSPKLYVTSDGGRHWKESSAVFNKQILGKFDKYTASTPYFFSAGDHNGFVPVMYTQGMSNKFSGYFTSDGGNSFRYVSFPLAWQTGMNSMLAPTFLNDKEGWNLQGSALYHTVDQGKTWTKLPESEKLTTTMEEYPEVVKLQFFSSKLGWILVQNSKERTSRLLQTQDGGISWHML
ncbi:hypothetical protein [Paenibacillus caui]|uniref:hypothetical protein n=1 Tax=Paenibacillus caui TaxID=2873927 RepID=UPI001CA9872E|nr:hypothetical protein [Paenibacillus caui]